MFFKVIWNEKAYEELEKLEPSISKRIFKKVEELQENPYNKDIKRLKGIEAFRLRIGDYRVIFSVERETIKILKVGHRRNIYN